MTKRNLFPREMHFSPVTTRLTLADVSAAPQTDEISCPVVRDTDTIRISFMGPVCRRCVSALA
jgi:hypothetical protein